MKEREREKFSVAYTNFDQNGRGHSNFTALSGTATTITTITTTTNIIVAACSIHLSAHFARTTHRTQGAGRPHHRPAASRRGLIIEDEK